MYMCIIDALTHTGKETTHRIDRRAGWLDVKAVQQDPGKDEQLGEVVEAKVDHHSCQTHHLERQGHQHTGTCTYNERDVFSVATM